MILYKRYFTLIRKLILIHSVNLLLKHKHYPLNNKFISLLPLFLSNCATNSSPLFPQSPLQRFHQSFPFSIYSYRRLAEFSSSVYCCPCYVDDSLTLVCISFVSLAPSVLSNHILSSLSVYSACISGAWSHPLFTPRRQYIVLNSVLINTYYQLLLIIANDLYSSRYLCCPLFYFLLSLF